MAMGHSSAFSAPATVLAASLWAAIGLCVLQAFRPLLVLYC